MDLAQLIETVAAVTPEEPFASVLRAMSDGKAKIAAVLENRKLVGVIAESDLARRKATPQAETSALRARDVMTTPVEQMSASSPVMDAARAMRPRKLQYLALVDESGDFVGLVTLRRVLFEVMDELDLKVDNLERELMADGPGG